METAANYRDMARQYRDLAEISDPSRRADRQRIADHLDMLARIAEQFEQGRK